MTVCPSAIEMLSLSPSLTLIVATTRTMGIGLNGTLPWPPLKEEMAYFTRVTKRPQPPSQKDRKHVNAVIMGRKTWESIPQKFRPLKGRVNVVISRTPRELGFTKLEGEGCNEEERPIAASGLDEGLEILTSLYPAPALSPPPSSNQHTSTHPQLGRIFVIGGAQLYASALQNPHCKRILLTEIHTEFECDTHFPVNLLSGEGKKEENEEGETWVKRGKGELDEWTGEEVKRDVREENGVRYEFGMWERVKHEEKSMV
ncbi:dihydrofolate reductase [Varicellaria rhodocarpa]|nr:dihydrofolate reductase [Varicellaria rhodocarpa]